MKILKITLPIILSVISLVVLFGAKNATADLSAATAGFITEYTIPTPSNGEPRNIVVEAPGKVWFTLPVSNAIGSLVVTSTVDYQFTLYDVPTDDSQPYDLAYDGRAIWFTELSGNRIGRLDIATGTITETALISFTNVAPTGIAIAPDGIIWFTERTGEKLGKFDPGTQTFSEPVSIPGGLLEDLDVAADSVWFTAPGTNRVYNYKPSTDKLVTAVVNEPGVPSWPPGNIVLDNTDNAWITAPTEGRIGKYIDATVTFWVWYSLPDTTGGPAGIDFSLMNGNRHVWFVEANAGRVGQTVFDVNGARLYTLLGGLPSANSQPLGIAVDANGDAWITESGTNKIAQWSAPYSYFTYLPVVLR